MKKSICCILITFIVINLFSICALCAETPFGVSAIGCEGTVVTDRFNYKSSSIDISLTGTYKTSLLNSEYIKITDPLGNDAKVRDFFHNNGTLTVLFDEFLTESCEYKITVNKMVFGGTADYVYTFLTTSDSIFVQNLRLEDESVIKVEIFNPYETAQKINIVCTAFSDNTLTDVQIKSFELPISAETKNYEMVLGDIAAADKLRVFILSTDSNNYIYTLTNAVREFVVNNSEGTL